MLTSPGTPTPSSPTPTSMPPTPTTERPGRVGPWLARVLRGGFSGRSWREFAYVMLGFPVALTAFMVVTLLFAFGVIFIVTFVGLPLIAVEGMVARWIGDFQRAVVRVLLLEDVRRPAPFRRGSGFLGWLQGALRDPAAWRARLYILVRVPLAMASFYVAIVAWAAGLFWTTYPLWWQLSGPGSAHQATRDPALDAGSIIGRGTARAAVPEAHAATLHLGHFTADTWPRAIGVVVAGLIVLVIAPWAVRAVVAIDRWLVRGLLGPSRGSERVRVLEEARTQVVDESAARLRRIERDLHDGAQAQLVTLAMQLGQAREKLAAGPAGEADAAGALTLVSAAHDNAKEALVELRDLARGIHPPALDVGLEAALTTLAARNAIPTELHVDVAVRPPEAIESIAYFTVAELLANATKHSGARRIRIDAATRGEVLNLWVQDDGVGGAHLGGGTGLAGLSDRVHAVDGGLRIQSPPGGPTVITVQLPAVLPAAHHPSTQPERRP